MDEIFDYIDELQRDLFSLPPQEIEQKYFEICQQLAGIRQIEEIYHVNMKEYETKLESSLQEGLQQLNQDIKAIYFEYDMDYEWAGYYYLCTNYSEMSEEDDDWACDWDVRISGPRLQEFNQIYEINGGFTEGKSAIGTTLFLIVRTVMSFLNVIQKYNVTIPICIGYHDQDPVMRTKRE